MTKQNMVTEFNHGKHDEAIHQAVKAIDDNPKDPKRYATLATMLIAIKAYDEATQLLMQAIGLFPNDAELVYNFGLLQFAQGNWQLAVQYFKQLVNQHNAMAADAQYMVALSYQQAQQPQKALAFALTAYDANPARLDASLLCAELLLGLGAFQEAAARLKPQLRTHNAQVLFTYGMALSGMGQDGSAYLDEAKRRDPAGYDQKAAQVRDIAGFLKQQGAADD
ncbi:tetratricopeptide repeat protein [Lacticaseibacillus baoqingensis]|uniref:Tetratricopeptide repeat protein n=1 Tax=Lacticaseibacillus baoqingensis TaxID=2486013 RepID=A0ABW4E5K2_9LACO|nr:tetratricopeptide repeat protein [Lacticaseibacillus baoqingensis]